MAREALPREVPLEDAIYNLARSALWPAALSSGRLRALREACRDRLHQPHRAHLMPGVLEAIEGALEAGALAAFVGGAGPTLAALARAGEEAPVIRALSAYRGPEGRTLVLGIGEGYFWKET